jgi:hypothetical protein
MPVEIELPDDNECISLDDYVDLLEKERYDLADQSDLIASAPLLKKLGNNKEFLIERAFAELRNCLQFQEDNIYGPQVLLLHATSEYFIRANIWKPITSIDEQVPGYRYDVCHDHNFDILTIGYLGPGYRSRAYTYDSAVCVGILCEAVKLKAAGDFTLKEGKVALYRAKRDVHIQLPPDRLSVSINLIPRGDAEKELQFQIDEASGTICRYLDFTGTEVAIRLAGLMGSRECLEALARVSQQHPSSKIRALALVSRLRIATESAGAILAEMNATQTELVRHIVESEVNEYGACMKMIGL